MPRPTTRKVFHQDTGRIGVLFTRARRVRGRVPVLFDGRSTVTLCLRSRLQLLNT